MVAAGAQIGWAQHTDEGSNEKASFFENYFGFHEPMYFIVGESDPGVTGGERLTAAKFQVSFLFELIDFYPGERRLEDPRRGINIAYTQTSFWDLESPSQPFFDTSYKPAAFLLYQQLGGLDMSWVHRLDIEAGYQHHSNGKGGLDSRFLDILYMKPTFVWRLFGWSYFFVMPKAWLYLTKSSLNADIADFWGYVRMDLTCGWITACSLRTTTGRAGTSTGGPTTGN